MLKELVTGHPWNGISNIFQVGHFSPSSFPSFPYVQKNQQNLFPAGSGKLLPILSHFIFILIFICFRKNKRGAARRGHEGVGSANTFPDDFVEQEIIGGVLLGEIHF